MNQLDPELRRLIGWARQAAPGPEPGVPFGLATRVTALSREAMGETEPRWAHYLRWSAAGLSLLVVTAGLLVWAGERREATNAYNFVPTIQLAAHNIAP